MRLLDRQDLKERKGVKFTSPHLWRLCRDGKFPRPVKIGTGRGSRNAWIEAEIDSWISERAAARAA